MLDIFPVTKLINLHLNLSWHLLVALFANSCKMSDLSMYPEVSVVPKRKKFSSVVSEIFYSYPVYIVLTIITLVQRQSILQLNQKYQAPYWSYVTLNNLHHVLVYHSCCADFKIKVMNSLCCSIMKELKAWIN